ncbi:leucyl aminopeptidase [Nocardioides donggukensis]|uniref:leucyl aminopeptidase n=1 Tax=Nocardioides donggukensis TaxID=2774019 RepID=UPI00191F5A07|nr:leucyl aminopeptidase [Nocardioides donggukensis]
MTPDPAQTTLPPQVSPPTFSLTTEPLTAAAGPVLVALPVLPADGAEAPAVGPGAADVADQLGLDLLAVLEAHRATGRAGEVTTHPVPDHDRVTAVLLVGVGDTGDDALRRAGAALGRATKDRDLVASSVASVAGDSGLHAFVIGLTLGSFEFHWRSSGPVAQPVRRVLLAGAPDRQPTVDAAVAVAAAGWRARALAATPSNLKSPAWLADRAVEVAQASGLACTVWDEKRLTKEGFGGILAVGRASATPPRLIRLDYRPRRARGHVVLVGKGITFDTGGLSIKPGEAMVNMKRDMTGGAVVIATMGALAELGCPVRVTGLVAAAENAIGGDAYRPGDVVRHFGGRTTEVTNTDAEGRVVLADALAYAVQELSPDALVDVATLTGAMKVALGLRTGGLFADHDVLATALEEAGRASGERLWRMPLNADYEEKLASKVADADNAPGGPGAITAALFLQHFTGDVPWAHLDIASVGDAPEDRDEWTAGPTGFGVRALLHWLSGADPLAGLR